MESEFKELFYVVTGEKPGIVPGWLQRDFVNYHLKKSSKNKMWFQMFDTKRSRFRNMRYAYPYKWKIKLDAVRNIGRKRKVTAGQDISELMKRAKIIDYNDI